VFWRIDRADRSRNATWARDEKSKKERKKKERKRERTKENKLRDMTSHIFAKTIYVALPPPKLLCGVESRTYQPCQGAKHRKIAVILGYFTELGSFGANYVKLVEVRRKLSAITGWR